MVGVSFVETKVCLKKYYVNILDRILWNIPGMIVDRFSYCLLSLYLQFRGQCDLCFVA